ncbi:uncharacterized protein LOC128222994 isoform X1 [Mya arenaria]|uniref:uncharacterized protein LOC128222994 isoform X1 n=2 Tax=Mya arenaria TaxID=6604 RepID=UPI0022E4394A|nr:uncharacterized protein LOC128222994 isoform X1 [Mya arenaria]
MWYTSWIQRKQSIILQTATKDQKTKLKFQAYKTLKMLPVRMFYKFACTIAVIGHTLALEKFECHGTLCNWKGEEQFCQAAYPYCRNCNDITDDCLTFTAPKNCSNTCHEFLKTKALQEQSNIKCPHLPSLQNGSYNEEGPFKHGQVAVATCDPGFTLTGDKSLFCFDGEWNVLPPVCTRVTCDDPPALMDGKWFIDDPAQNTYVARFQCNAEFDLVGPKEWQCSLKGTLEPVSKGLGTIFPVCQKKHQMNQVIFYIVVSVSGVLATALVVSLVCLCYFKQKIPMMIYDKRKPKIRDVETGYVHIEKDNVQHDKEYDNVNERAKLLETTEETKLVKSERDEVSQLSDESSHKGSDNRRRVSAESKHGDLRIDVNISNNQAVNFNGDTATKQNKQSNNDHDKDEGNIPQPVHHDQYPTQETEHSDGCEPSAPDISLLNDSDNENDSNSVIYNEINDITRDIDREAEGLHEPVATILADNADIPTANIPFEVERGRDVSVIDQRQNPISQETEQQSSISKANVSFGNSSIPAVDMYKR